MNDTNWTKLRPTQLTSCVSQQKMLCKTIRDQNKAVAAVQCGTEIHSSSTQGKSTLTETNMGNFLKILSLEFRTGRNSDIQY